MLDNDLTESSVFILNFEYDFSQEESDAPHRSYERSIVVDFITLSIVASRAP